MLKYSFILLAVLLILFSVSSYVSASMNQVAAAAVEVIAAVAITFSVLLRIAAIAVAACIDGGNKPSIVFYLSCLLISIEIMHHAFVVVVLFCRYVLFCMLFVSFCVVLMMFVCLYYDYFVFCRVVLSCVLEMILFDAGSKP